MTWILFSFYAFHPWVNSGTKKIEKEFFERMKYYLDICLNI